MSSKRKPPLSIIILLNLLLWVGKFFIISYASLEAFVGDYKNPLTTTQKAITFGKGILIALILDIMINFIALKIVNAKYEKKISYKKILFFAFALTIIETFFIISFAM